MRAFRVPARGLSFDCLRRPLFFQQRQRDVPRPGAGHVLTFVSDGLFSFSSERKEEKKRRQKLRFWISLRGFTYSLSRRNKPRERCAAQISPKYCIVSASLFAAAFALKCRSNRFYRGRDQRQRRRRRDDPFVRTTSSNPRDRAVQTNDTHAA